VILLDTHALLWWVQGDDRLSPGAAGAIAAERGQAGTQGVLVSAISCWEVAMLVRRERLALSLELETWLDTVATIPSVRLLPLEPRTAVAATKLPGDFHDDPTDRFLVAQARQLDVPLLTADEKIRRYPHVRVLW
jgi:PIN domain nuclease of toxin-antitoxin system